MNNRLFIILIYSCMIFIILFDSDKLYTCNYDLLSPFNFFYLIQSSLFTNIPCYVLQEALETIHLPYANQCQSDSHVQNNGPNQMSSDSGHTVLLLSRERLILKLFSLQKLRTKKNIDAQLSSWILETSFICFI